MRMWTGVVVVDVCRQYLSKIDMKDSTIIFMIIVLGMLDISISISGLFTYSFLGFRWFVCLINLLTVFYLLWITYKNVKNKK